MPRLTQQSINPLTPSKTLKKKKSGGFRMRSRSFYKSILGGFLGLSIVWFSISDTPRKLKENLMLKIHRLTSAQNLAVKTIILEGNFYTQKSDLLKHLDLKAGSSILQYDPLEIKSKAETLPWIRSVKVQRTFPDTLIIKIAEKLPIALWQKNKHLTLVDDQGCLISSADTKDFSYLPIVIGDQAAEKAPQLFEMLSAEPLLQKRLTAAILISKRRWDLILDKNIKVKLPENETGTSLKQLVKIEQDKHVDMKEIIAIDLRIPDRVYVHMKQGAAVARRSVSNRNKV